MDDLVRVERSFEGARLGNDMVSIGLGSSYMWRKEMLENGTVILEISGDVRC